MPELHLVGLPGPTRIRGGEAETVSNPRAAVTQAIAMMRSLLRHGLPVAAMPPLERPDKAFLHACGFSGGSALILAAAAARAPALLRIAMSDTAMFTANLATCVPTADANDQRIHIAVANLAVVQHRQIEASPRAAQLRLLFPDRARVTVHDPLPAIPALGDGGSANHHRLHTGDRTCHLLIHGRDDTRQSRIANETIARMTAMSDPLHICLSEMALAAGAAFGDQVMTGCRDRILIHERAWADQDAALEELRRRVPGVRTAVVREAELPLAESLRSGFLASCLLRTSIGHVLVCPATCRAGPARRVVDRLLADGFIGAVEHLDLGECLPAGQGPSGMRLRLPLVPEESGVVLPGIVCDGHKLDTLEAWARSTYRESLTPGDLADPKLADETRSSLDLLARLLGLPTGFYPS